MVQWWEITGVSCLAVQVVLREAPLIVRSTGLRQRTQGLGLVGVMMVRTTFAGTIAKSLNPRKPAPHALDPVLLIVD